MSPAKRRPASPAAKPTRAVCYVRISVDRDNETSTETQEERVRAYCKANGWSVVDVVTEPGRSAYGSSRSSRPGFRRAMGLISSGAADVLVVWKLDRASRNTEDALALVRQLAEYDAQLVSVTEHFDTSTPSGRMTLSVLAALAEMESATKSERVLAWQEKRRTGGMVPTGPRPYGYQRRRNELVIDRSEAAQLRRAAKQLLAGQSVRATVLTKDGKPLERKAVRKALTNPVVVACREVDGQLVESDAWKPILDRDTWDELRALLGDPARRISPTNGRRWLLSGIARCARCVDDEGVPVGMRCKPSKGESPRYFCPTCHLSIEAERTDELVSGALLALLDAKTWRRLRQGRPAVADEGFEEAMATLSQRFVAGDIDAVQLADLAEALRRQQAAASTAPPKLPDVTDVRKAWPKLSLEQKRLVISAATESLTIKPWARTRGFDVDRIVWVPVA